MKHVSILIVGPPNSGKSTLSEIITEALEEKGFTATLEEEGVPNYSERVLREASLRGKIKITVNSMQTHR